MWEYWLCCILSCASNVTIGWNLAPHFPNARTTTNGGGGSGGGRVVTVGKGTALLVYVWRYSALIFISSTRQVSVRWWREEKYDDGEKRVESLMEKDRKEGSGYREHLHRDRKYKHIIQLSLFLRWEELTYMELIRINLWRVVLTFIANLMPSTCFHNFGSLETRSIISVSFYLIPYCYLSLAETLARPYQPLNHC